MLHAKNFIFVFTFSLLSTYNVIVLHILTHYTLYNTIIVVVKSYELLLLYYSINNKCKIKIVDIRLGT